MTQLRRSHSRRLGTFGVLPLLLGTLCLGLPQALTVVGCGADSTNTGNPPVVDRQKLSVTASGDDVVVAGEAGAVPSVARVTVTNLATEESESTTATDDGSFEVTLAGGVDDEYHVEVEVRGRKTSTNVTATANADPGAGFVGKDFLLESAEGISLVEDTTVRLSFSETSLSYYGGCNTMSGTYSVCDGKLCISESGSTLLGCSEALLAQDEWFSDFLTGTPALEYAGDTLTLTSMDATLEFLDREVADPDRPLTGPTWVIDTFIMGGAASNVSLDAEPTVTFADDGTFEAYTTCNTLIGSFVVDGPTLTLSDVSTTDIACPLPATMNAEQHIAQVLSNGEVAFEIDANRLALTRGELGLSATTE